MNVKYALMIDKKNIMQIVDALIVAALIVAAISDNGIYKSMNTDI